MTKSKDLIRELEQAGFCLRKKSRGNHAKYTRGNVSVAVPRHREIDDRTAAQIRFRAGLDGGGRR